MRHFVIRVLINAVAIAVTAMLIPNIQVANNDISTLLLIGLIFGVVNSMLKPILLVLTCPRCAPFAWAVHPGHQRHNASDHRFAGG